MIKKGIRKRIQKRIGKLINNTSESNKTHNSNK